jgi:SNF2 family DNA or RNA helicase
MAGLGGILADDMGLGKTLQAITALRGRSLVVAPTSVLFNWKNELARFRPKLRVALYYGPTRSLARDVDVVLTSYALLRLDIKELTGQRWDTVVLDEAQAIKNPDSQTARAAYALQGDFKLSLSGTPVENRLEELWSQMHFVNPGLLGSRSDFNDRYAKPIEQGEPGAAPRLRERVAPFVLRRLKREVAPELPPRTEVVLRCELSDAERAIYDVVRAASMRDVVDKLTQGQGNVMQALEALLRLRQVASHASMVPGGEAVTQSAKVSLLVDKLEEAVADGHKALVFSQWTSLLDRVEGPLNEAKLPFTRLDGSTPDRGAVVARFQAEDGPPIMLVSLKAGGTGLNLTAADHVFLLDPWWNPAVEDQAADRAHRIGQDKPVMVYRLVAQDTVEERMLELQARKRSLADAALSGGDAALGLTRDDLLELLAE